MKSIEVLTASEQVALHLKEELLRGTWAELMPGENYFMSQLCVGRNTVREAMILLEEEGYLQRSGTGKQRRITLPKKRPSQSLSVGVLLYDDADLELPKTNILCQGLLRSGHTPMVVNRTLHDLHFDPGKVKRLVKRHDFDAWITNAAPSSILESLVETNSPTFSIYGGLKDLPVAGVYVHKIPKMENLLQHLVDLGHTRIVNITRRERIVPEVSLFEKKFISKLNECGIQTSDYHLPVWGPEPKGLCACLDKIFRHTPPTAIYTGEYQLFNAIYNHLSGQDILAPRDVSLICGESHNSFQWFKTPPDHFHWDQNRIAQYAIRWVDQIARGRTNTKQTKVSVQLVRGGTVGPPP